MVAATVVAGLSLGGCKAADQAPTASEVPAVQAAGGDDSGRRPIMLHARIAYTAATDESSIGSSSGARFLLELQQPAFRMGEGAKAEYEVDNDHPIQVVGSLHGYGQAHMTVDGGELTEHYDERARWPQWSTPAKGRFSIGMPGPSDIGDGLSLKLEVHAAVEGSRTAHVQSKDVSANVEPSFSIPTACSSHSDDLRGIGEACGFELTLDAAPTAAKSAAGEQLLPPIQKGLALPNGEWMMAGTGSLFGATTTYRDRGHFVLTYRRALAFTEKNGRLSDDFRIVVWSTDRNEDWKPADLPPLQ